MFVKVANSPARLFLTFIVLMLVSSGIYSVAEHAGILDSLYWSVVTATTLGYGDFAPNTSSGKVLTTALISLTVFVFIPMITANISSKLIVDRDAFTHEEQEELKETLRRLEQLLDQHRRST